MENQEQLYYRPPLEANSLLVEVTKGCTHGKCTFCQNQLVKFSTVPMESIEKEIMDLSELRLERKSVFLVGANALILKTAFLKRIFGMIHQYLPEIQKISMYARADDVNRKTKGRVTGIKKLRLR